ncbi:IS4 family transposase [bacterium]|nr:IS4 family transposase [bacterium]MBU1290809.1 IS4 family transposase [bacterium]MBU2439414.1 IS4 family transposase [bacterium]
MRHSNLRVTMDINHSNTICFIEHCKAIKDSHFTRNRKLPLHQLLLSILSRKGRTLTMEIRSFIKSIKSKISISKPGYLKQRQKLNPEVFLELSDFHVRNFYKDTTMVQRLKGYLILAVDGSSVNVPNTVQNVELYGNASHKNAKPQAQLGISCLFDVLNKMIIDCTINKWKFSERNQALLHIDKCNSITGKKPRIVIFDRGYPSGEFFIDLMERNESFLIRIGATVFKKEQLAMTADDEYVNIMFDKSRLSPHKGRSTADKLAKTGSIQLRFVRFELDNGSMEYLATNLPMEEFNTSEIVYLYRLRWEIETAYNVLKNKLFIENFTGTKPIMIEQDIYATVYLCNVMHDILLDAKLEFNIKNHQKYKYKMEINKNIAIGIMKEELIRFILEEDKGRKKEMFDEIIVEISSNILPVRNGRHYERTKGQLSGTYSNVNKRSF